MPKFLVDLDTVGRVEIEVEAVDEGHAYAKAWARVKEHDIKNAQSSRLQLGKRNVIAKLYVMNKGNVTKLED